MKKVAIPHSLLFIVPRPINSVEYFRPNISVEYFFDQSIRSSIGWLLTNPFGRVSINQFGRVSTNQFGRTHSWRINVNICVHFTNNPAPPEDCFDRSVLVRWLLILPPPTACVCIINTFGYPRQQAGWTEQRSARKFPGIFRKRRETPMSPSSWGDSVTPYLCFWTCFRKSQTEVGGCTRIFAGLTNTPILRNTILTTR